MNSRMNKLIKNTCLWLNLVFDLIGLYTLMCRLNRGIQVVLENS